MVIAPKAILVSLIILTLAFAEHLIGVPAYGMLNWILLPVSSLGVVIFLLLERRIPKRLVLSTVLSSIVILFWAIPTQDWQEGVRYISTVLLFLVSFEFCSKLPLSYICAYVNKSILFLVFGGLVLAIGQILDGVSRIYGYTISSPTSFAFANLLVFCWPVQLSKNKSIDLIFRLIAGLLVVLTKTTTAYYLLIIYLFSILAFFIWRNLPLKKLHKSLKNLIVGALICLMLITSTVSIIYANELIDKANNSLHFIGSRDDWEQSVNTRFNIYANLVFSKNFVTWILGSGVGSAYRETSEALGKSMVPHWDLLAMIYDFGIIGFVIFLFIFYWFIKILINNRLNRGIIFISIVGTSQNLIYVPLLVMLVAVSLGLSYNSLRRMETFELRKY